MGRVRNIPNLPTRLDGFWQYLPAWYPTHICKYQARNTRRIPPEFTKFPYSKPKMRLFTEYYLVSRILTWKKERENSWNCPIFQTSSSNIWSCCCYLPIYPKYYTYTFQSEATHSVRFYCHSTILFFSKNIDFSPWGNCAGAKASSLIPMFLCFGDIWI